MAVDPFCDGGCGDEIECVADDLDGWVWNRRRDGVEYRRGMYRLSDGYLYQLAEPYPGADKVDVRIGKHYFPCEQGALAALIADRRGKATRLNKRADQMEKRLIKVTERDLAAVTQQPSEVAGSPETQTAHPSREATP